MGLLGGGICSVLVSILVVVIAVQCGTATAGFQSVGSVLPGLAGSQMNWIDKDGKFLVSNDSNFALGFIKADGDATQFLLGVLHVGTQITVWSANRGSPVSNSDNFTFDKNGDLALYKGSDVVWSSGTGNKGVSAMELRDSGNLVLVGSDGGIVWQSFSHPVDTLLSNQELFGGMKLVAIGASNASYTLQISSGDVVLSAEFDTPQLYWSMRKDNRMTINKDGGPISYGKLEANSWNFYDENKNLLWEYIFSPDTNVNATWIAVLGQDGTLSFKNLPSTGSGSVITSNIKIPSDVCSTPEPCEPYSVCHETSNRCTCPPALQSYPNCSAGFVSSPCSSASKGVSTSLVNVGDGISYFALGFSSPGRENANLESCKSSCLSNCSCLVMFFQNSTGSCYMFDSVGAFQSSSGGSGFAAYVKVPGNGGPNAGSSGGGKNMSHVVTVILIAVVTVIVILGLIYGAFRYYKSRVETPESPREGSEDEFLESLSGMPVRFTFKELQTATDNFTTKLGQGGFGSVYKGTLPDGTRLAVKKLEGIGQGKKEFRAEVCIIGSIHHHHLVRLRGFCAEGAHRLLAYEYMANGSLDRWIFRKDKGEMLDWNTRFNIAVGTAKGLAYLHEDCDDKIVHCDIKPENVLLDDNFLAKVSDFGLAKLMTREQSNVFTTLRGTRGYLAPEWITNYAISEKSDVYSYGMVLLEIIGGRKSFDPSETSEKCHFPSYAFKMMEEGKLRDILDSTLRYDERDERVTTAIKVALWCIQEDMALRPSMTRVVQMLEGLCPVPQPPITTSPLGARIYSSFFKSLSEEGTSSGPSDCNSDAYLSAVRLSGPR